MPGMFTGMARAYGGAREKAKEIQDAEHKAAIQKLALDMGLREQGVIPDEEAQRMEQAAQVMGAVAPLTAGSPDMSQAPQPKATKVGAGYSRVSTMTPEYRAQQVERAKQRRAEQEEGKLQNLMRRAMAGDEEAKAAVLMKHPSFANTVFKPKEPRREYDRVRGAVVDVDAGSASPVKGLPARQAIPRAGGGSGTSGTVKFESNWKASRFRELVRERLNPNTGRLMPGLTPEQASAKVEAEWAKLAKIVPASYLRAAAEDPEYAEYLRSQLPEEDEE